MQAAKGEPHLSWWYITFGTEPGMTTEEGFRGACFVRAASPHAAIRRADQLLITPFDDSDYEAAVFGPLDEDDLDRTVPPLNLERLLTLTELGAYRNARMTEDGWEMVE